MMKRKLVLRGLSLLLTGTMTLQIGMGSICVSAMETTETVEASVMSVGNDAPIIYLAEDFEDYTGTAGAAPEGFFIRGEKSWSGAYTQDGTSVSLKISETLSGSNKEVSLTKEFDSNIAGKVIVDLEINALDTNGNVFIESGGSASAGGNGKTEFATITTADGKIKFNKVAYELPNEGWNRVSFAIDFDGGAPKTTLYINGVETASADLTGTTDFNYIRVRGRRVIDNSNFEFLVDNMRVYSGTEPETPTEPDVPSNPEDTPDTQIAVYLAENFEDYTGTAGAAPEGFFIRGEKSWSGVYTQDGTSVSLKISETLSGANKEVSLTKEFDSNIEGKVIVDLDINSLDTNGNIFIESGGDSSAGGNGKTTFATITTADGKIKFNEIGYELPNEGWNGVSFAIDFDGGVPKTTLYINGVETASADLTGTTGINYIRVRGRRVVDNSNFEFLVDNMCVYSGAELKTMEELTGNSSPETPSNPDAPDNPDMPENPNTPDNPDNKTEIHLVADFETYDKQGSAPSGFEMTGGSAVKATSGSDKTEDGTSVRLQIADTVDLTTTPDVGLAKTFGTDNLNGKLVLDWDMKTTDKNGTIMIEIKDTAGNGLALASVSNGNTITMGGKTFTDIGMRENDWNRISIALNFDGTKVTVTLYVNGIMVDASKDIAINNSKGIKGINYFRIRAKRLGQDSLIEDINGKKNVTVYLDNMRVYSGSELKTMEELLELNIPDSLLDFNNDLGIDVTDRLVDALVMVEGSTNSLRNNIKVKDAVSPENKPCKVDGVLAVPLKYVVEYFGGSVTLSEQRADVTIGGQGTAIVQGEGVLFTGSDVLVSLEQVGDILGKEVYTDYKGRGLIVIGNNPAPFDDSRDLVDEDLKPQETEKFYIEEAIKEVVYDRPSGAEVVEALTQKDAAHPRIMATSEDFARVKNLIASGDVTMNEWYQDIIKQGEKHLAMAVATNDLPDGRRMTGSRQVGPLVINLGMLYHLSDDTAKKEEYKNRIWKEVYTVSQFPDWNESNEFLNTAEFMEGVAIAYDWLYDAWTPEQREILETAIINKGLIKTLEAYNNNVWWIHTYPRANNWNAVCNGTATLALMAIGDIEREITLPSKEKVTMQEFAATILDTAFNALEDFILLEFMPDGAWSEGPSYWGYTLEYLVRFMSSLETAVGTAYGYDQTPGLDETAYFPMYLSGAVGSLNYGDASDYKIIAAEELWIAQKFNDDKLVSLHMDNLKAMKKTGSEFEMLWYNPDSYNGGETLVLDKHFAGTEVATFRSKWNDSNASFLGLKAGNNVVSHGHYDLGSFVFEALGQKWAVDLGADDYNLSGYSDYAGKRLWYYRLNPEGHNTLVINPDGTAQQNIEAFAKIEKIESKDRGGFAITDLTDAYKDDVNNARRGVMLSSNRTRATIQDEVTFKAPSQVYWFMHTQAEITISKDGKSAILSKGGEQLWVGLDCDAVDASGNPVAACFTEMTAAPLAVSPSPSGQNKNEGYRKLAVEMNGVSQMRLTVVLIPVSGSLDEINTTIVPVALDAWSIEDGELEVPVLNGVTMDGQAFANFDSSVYGYDIDFPLDRIVVPEIAVSYDESHYSVEIIKATDIPGSTKILVSSLENPEIKSIYKFNFKLNPINGEEEKLVEVPIVTYKASASQADKGNVEANAFDNNFDTYWAAEGDQWIEMDLGKSTVINSIGIAFIKGNERCFQYEIQTSEDGEEWENKYSGASSGESLEMEMTYLKQHEARYIRVLGHGNSTNKWNSYAEVRIYQLPTEAETPEEKTEDNVNNEDNTWKDNWNNFNPESPTGNNHSITAGKPEGELRVPSKVEENIKIEVRAGAPKVEVGNMGKLYKNPLLFDEKDQKIVKAGGKVEFTFTIEKLDEEKVAPKDREKIVEIKEKDFVIGMFLDLGVSKEVVDVRGNRVDSQCRTSISDLGEDQLLKVELALTPELCGKAAYKVYRIHDDVAEALPTNGKGERIETNETKDKLTIYIYKFSTYAIYYSDEEVLDADTPTTEVSFGGKDNESAGVVLEEPSVKKKNMFLILIAGITIAALAGSGAVFLRKNK